MRHVLFTLGIISTLYWLPFVPVATFLIFKDVFFISTFVYIVVNSKFSAYFGREFLVLLLLLGLLFLRDLFVSPINASIRYLPLIFTTVTLATINYQSFRLIRNELVRGLLVGSTLNALYLLLSLYQGFSMAPASLVGGWASHYYAPYGLTNSHTLLSPLLAISVIHAFSRGKYILTVLLGFALVLTNGEGGILSTIIIFLVYLGFKVVKNRLIFLLITTLLLLRIIPFVLEFAMSDNALLLTINEHFYSTKLGLEIFRNNILFGVGSSQLYELAEHYSSSVSGIEGISVFTKSLEPHNFLAYTLAAGGIVSGVLIFYLYVILIQRIVNDRMFASSSKVIGIFMIVSLLEPWVFVGNIYMNIFLIICLRNEKGSSVLQLGKV